MYRTKSFDEMVSKELQDPMNAREFMLASMEGEDGKNLIDALKRTISIMGVSEFAELIGVQRSNVSRMLSQDDIPKIETLNRYLEPFKLRVRIDVEEVA